LPHQAFSIQAGISWKPGVRYIEFPDRKMSLGSKYPLFAVQFTKGFKGVFGSDISYLKWMASVKDELNLKLGGSLHYAIYGGGFLNSKAVQLPDLKHFNGNQVVVAASYLTGFQALPYYQYANVSNFYLDYHLEHHFNGLISNKIPGFRRLNWYFVGGVNGFWLPSTAHYEELFLGLENIFKVGRADMVWSFDQGRFRGAYFRFSVRGILSASSD
jgi:hypothetical protein